jgi:hypothetical protein
VILRASKWDSPEALAQTPIATPAGSVLPLGELVEVESRSARAACAASTVTARSAST